MKLCGSKCRQRHKHLDLLVCRFDIGPVFRAWFHSEWKIASSAICAPVPTILCTSCYFAPHLMKQFQFCPEMDRDFYGQRCWMSLKSFASCHRRETHFQLKHLKVAISSRHSDNGKIAKRLRILDRTFMVCFFDDELISCRVVVFRASRSFRYWMAPLLYFLHWISNCSNYWLNHKFFAWYHWCWWSAAWWH